jgi:hypothetical protein
MCLMTVKGSEGSFQRGQSSTILDNSGEEANEDRTKNSTPHHGQEGQEMKTATSKPMSCSANRLWKS